MKFELMTLPYEDNGLEPYLSAETIAYHHGKHHGAYVKNLNGLIENTEFENQSLDYIIKNSTGAVFNNAAQVFNHDFYWLGLCGAPTQASEQLSLLIQNNFGSMEDFKKAIFAQAMSLFGSGWVWLILTKEGKLSIEKFSNADTPIAHDKMPLLTCDIWEHAYYIDYRNGRANYLENWWKLINWDFISTNLTNT